MVIFVFSNVPPVQSSQRYEKLWMILVKASNEASNEAINAYTVVKKEIWDTKDKGKKSMTHDACIVAATVDKKTCP